LIGGGLRRQELAQLKFEDIVAREGRAVTLDLVGKGRGVGTLAAPFWVKQTVDRWTQAALPERPYARIFLVTLDSFMTLW
jgi:integrase